MNDHKPQLDRYLNVRKDLVVNPPEFKDVEEIRINE
jgi:hypothetical protein